MELNYFEPDPIFAFYQIHSEEEYLNQYLVKADFGTEITEDLKNSYKTAEYLMAHAYFHWPIYDEALWKVLGIYKMAIKFRCKELGIELKKSNQKEKRLVDLQKELMNSLQVEEFQFAFDWIRNLRNGLAHPEIHSYGGPSYKMHIEMILMFIKKIFEVNFSEK